MRTCVLALAVFAFASPAFAQAPLRAADADGDGAITREEFKANSAKNFLALDKNGDGALSADERPAQGGGRLGGGGFAGGAGGGAREPINRERFEQIALARFDRLDANDDGVLSAEEMRAAQGARAGQR
jgi:hypothetical protein